MDCLKNLIVNLMNNCYKLIDRIPKELLVTILCGTDIKGKMDYLHKLLNSKYRFCAFIHRMYSEFCFKYALGLKDTDIKALYLSKDIFKYSMDYKIIAITRKLQTSLYTSKDLQLMENTLKDYLSETNYQEPYYKYLFHNKLTNLREQRDYFRNCINLLLIYLRLIVEVEQSIVEVDYLKMEKLRNIRN